MPPTVVPLGMPKPHKVSHSLVWPCQSRGKPWLPIAQNSLGCIVTPREKDLSPRFGNAGRDRRDHLAQSIKASYRHRLFRNLELGRQRSCVGFNITEAATSGRSSCSKPMLISWHKEVKGVGVNFWSRLHRAGLLDGRFFPPETIWKSRWSTSLFHWPPWPHTPWDFQPVSSGIRTSLKKQSWEKVMTFYS